MSGINQVSFSFLEVLRGDACEFGGVSAEYIVDAGDAHFPEASTDLLWDF